MKKVEDAGLTTGDWFPILVKCGGLAGYVYTAAEPISTLALADEALFLAGSIVEDLASAAAVSYDKRRAKDALEDALLDVADAADNIRVAKGNLLNHSDANNCLHRVR